MAKKKIIVNGGIFAVASEKVKEYDLFETAVEREKTDEEFEDLLNKNTIEETEVDSEVPYVEEAPKEDEDPEEDNDPEESDDNDSF